MSTNYFSPHPRLLLCRVWQILGFSVSQVPGKGLLGLVILRARLVIASPLFVEPAFVFSASPQSLYWATMAHLRCKMQDIGRGNSENNLDVWNVCGMRKFFRWISRVDFPTLGQL
jgi:hypothetical protein